jgi:hypothetical protein
MNNGFTEITRQIYDRNGLYFGSKVMEKVINTIGRLISMSNLQISGDILIEDHFLRVLKDLLVKISEKV